MKQQQLSNGWAAQSAKRIQDNRDINDLLEDGALHRRDQDDKQPNDIQDLIKKISAVK